MRESIKRTAKALLVITLLSSPYWASNLAWHLAGPSDRQVLVIDYTVPEDIYAGHRGLMWVLNYARVPSPDAPRPWDPEADYTGYYPHDRTQPSRLSDVPLGATDLLYIADAYGVYEMDLEMIEGVRIQPTISPLLFGGLNTQDAGVIEQFVASGHDLLVEFKAVTPPTSSAARDTLERLCDVRWTGWVGRVFPDLYDITDVPDWFDPLFEEHFPGREKPRDPCLVLFGPASELVVFCDPDFATVAPRLTFTEVGRDRLGNVRADAAYFGWFVLSEPGPMSITMAELVLPEALVGLAEFHAAELPLRHPVLTERVVGPSHRIAMHIDGANAAFDPGRYNMAGIHRAQALFNRRRDLLSPRPAFWQFYVPAMRAILRE